ncbi:MAG: transcriptional regulator NrdR [Methanobacterium sp. PtaU1.Bin097]|nr:MAG: transcriptional regulator NrdR [Methanobacterium sp. PtaU1.Bin097]
MTVVRKRSGDKEPFDEVKLKRSIQKAGIDAGYTLDDISDEVDEITGKILEMANQKIEINSDAIRDHILVELDETKPSIAEAWRRFDEKYKGSGYL